MRATLPLLQKIRFPVLRRAALQTLQVNLGYLCNQQCVHCHVNAGPRRTEIMSAGTVDVVLDFLAHGNVTCLDLTGGAPELNPEFRRLVVEARRMGIHVIDRCNLTILGEPGQEDLAEFLAGERVEIVASLPCYLEQNVERQRGKGVYQGSISGLQALNRLGYGRPESGLVLNLVFNPQGPQLPPEQQELERDYRRYLAEHFDIAFNQLLTITNMPVQRFGSMLLSTGQFDDYMELLKQSHQDANLEQVMCRSLLSVDWQGYVYDCDFNQMLNLPIAQASGRRIHLSEIHGADLEGQPIVVAGHCYGCTAGRGSSCRGALA